MTDQDKHEWLMCAESCAYFLNQYAQIYDATLRTWLPFRLWQAQIRTLRTMLAHQLVIILKARQLGLTWLCLGLALWLMLFRPAATVLIFSRRDDEAMYLMGNERLKGMYSRLPAWMQARSVARDSDHTWTLSNGSVARAFPTSAGDSYTATYALVDEADLVPDLDRLLRAVKPTIDGGGKLVLLSRADKSQPQSAFKQIYRAAKAGTSPWASVFLPWQARPDRDAQWYETQRRDVLSRTGALDDLFEQYPADDAEALAPRSLDKRLPATWLNACYHESAALIPIGAPAINGLVIYAAPRPDGIYVLGLDPAEGNPTSDDSALTVLDADTGEEMAVLAGKFQPSTFAAHADAIGHYYNKAALLVERNNHGHAVLLWLEDNSRLSVLDGLDDRPGWLSSTRGKALLYSAAADAFKDGTTTLHSFATYMQLASIEGATLRAPDGELDDLADSYALALVARALAPATISRGTSPLAGWRG